MLLFRKNRFWTSLEKIYQNGFVFRLRDAQFLEVKFWVSKQRGSKGLFERTPNWSVTGNGFVITGCETTVWTGFNNTERIPIDSTFQAWRVALKIRGNCYGSRSERLYFHWNTECDYVLKAKIYAYHRLQKLQRISTFRHVLGS